MSQGVSVNQAVLLQFKAAVLSVWIFCSLGSVCPLSLVLEVTVLLYLPVAVIWAQDIPGFFQIYCVQLGCYSRALQETRSTSRQCMGGREYAKAILCYSMVWKPGANPNLQ